MADQLPSDLADHLTQAIQYVIDRGHDPYNKLFFWSPLEGFESRIILGFYYHGEIVGYTARKTTEGGRPKYLSEQHPHFLFNVDNQHENQKYVFACEGPFDALAIGGTALLTNGMGDQQARILNSLQSEIIVIPDQDKAGLELIEKAIHYNFSVAFPNWDNDVKDVADAVQRYGKLFVVVDAIKTAVSGEIKIRMAMKALEKKIKRIEDDQESN
jgi:DNA primase